MDRPWLIALDVDGTLFGEDMAVSSRVRAALARARAAGHLVTLATGRSFEVTRPIAASLGIDSPLITYQGAVLQSEREVIWQQALPLAIAREVISFAEERALSAHAYLPDGVFAARRAPETRFYEALNPGVPVRFVGALSAFLTADPIKILLNLDPARADAVFLELSRLIGARASVVRSHTRFVEVTHSAVNKGRALLALAEWAGIPASRTLGIGDQLNDLPLVEAAGIGVAMGNAVPGLKEIADWVAPPVHEDGAAVAIERFILDGPSEQ